jgi:uncharacterized repeat protein (TIGR03843 family)
MTETIEKTILLTALQKGEISLQGQFLRGSNYTFLANLVYPGREEFAVVYKPTRGEQPLWDFPSGTLAKREVVAYLVSEVLCWDLVPPTVYRRKGPLGPGSVQKYVEHDPDYHYFNFEADDRQRLRPVMLFDLLINNADRKGSHVLVDNTSHLWLIDHGLCFHEEDKLRTVIWDFAGEDIPRPLLEDLRRLVSLFDVAPLAEIRPEENPSLDQEIRHFLSPAEVRAMVQRARGLIERGCFPPPISNRRAYPWPPV